MIVRLVILILVLGISSEVLLEYADGLVEIKKYKSINSPKVCGDKLCSATDEKKSNPGKLIHNIKICRDKPCNEIQTQQDNQTNESSPHGQFRLGIALDEIKCKNGQAIVIKKTTQFPACVDIKNIEKLRVKDWAILADEQGKIFKKISTNKINTETLTEQDKFDVSLSIVPQEISNKRFLMFDGHGWHQLHNVEITITGDGFEESIRTKTDDRGGLNMPWPIPDEVGGKFYNFFATDGIHEFEIDIPIAPKNAR